MKKPAVMIALLVLMGAVAYATSSTALEVAATLTGLLCVWLTAREQIWAWPIGLVNVACFFYIFYEVKLYADMTLQIFFFALGVYGWAVWLTKREGRRVRPTRLITRRLAAGLAAGIIVVTLLWGYGLHTYTDASIPYMDAFIATLSLAAQYLLSSKILENWLLWITVDILSVGMYAYKGLYAIAFLYLVFLAIAISGYVSWRREFQASGKESGIHAGA